MHPHHIGNQERAWRNRVGHAGICCDLPDSRVDRSAVIVPPPSPPQKGPFCQRLLPVCQVSAEGRGPYPSYSLCSQALAAEAQLSHACAAQAAFLVQTQRSAIMARGVDGVEGAVWQA